MITVNPLEVINKYSSQVPVPVYEILDELGLGPTFQFMDENISGWIERRPDGTYGVAVNNNHAHVRQRFTAAHELGHYIYHRDLLGQGVGDTRAYRAEGTPLPNTAIRPIHERQANSFAANLLMPRATIARLKAGGVTVPADLADQMEVSLHAMCIRLGIPY
jgi:Zn-dependent peptidase ImmA (M78 family)